MKSKEDEIDLIQNEDDIEVLEFESMQAGELSDSEKENLQKLGPRRKKMRILSDAEIETSITGSSRNIEAFCDTEIAVDVTTWIKLVVGGSSGRYPSYKIL